MVDLIQGLSHSPTAASFIRPSRPRDPKRDFLEALRFKYLGHEGSSTSDADGVPIIYEFGRKPDGSKPIKISGKEVEEVGFDKLNRQLAELDKLTRIYLDGLCLHQPLPSLDQGQDCISWYKGNAVSDEISRTCPSVVDLDLSSNMLSSLGEIATICLGLQRLEELRLE